MKYFIILTLNQYGYIFLNLISNIFRSMPNISKHQPTLAVKSAWMPEEKFTLETRTFSKEDPGREMMPREGASAEDVKLINLYMKGRSQR